MIHSLRSHQFRNLADGHVDFDAGWSLAVGDNGAGKTSLLEALYMAATSKSFLSHKLIDCCRRGSSAFVTEVETRKEGRVRLRLAWDRDDGVRRTINDSTDDLAEYLQVQPILAYTARDADLLDGAPAARRRFMDGNLVNEDPASIRLLARLRALIEAKRAALAERQPIEPWNELLVPAVVELQARRRRLIEDLEQHTRPMVDELGLGERQPRLVYVPSTPGGRLDDAGRDDEETKLLATLDRRKQEELECGYPLWGPQRDDWRWSWDVDDRVEIRRRASRGEKKALTIALFAACCRRLVEHGRWASLLIDDLDSELDSRRRAQVCALLTDLPQVVATTSRAREWDGAQQPITHEIAEGRIRRVR